MATRPVRAAWDHLQCAHSGRGEVGGLSTRCWLDIAAEAAALRVDRCGWRTRALIHLLQLFEHNPSPTSYARQFERE